MGPAADNRTGAHRTIMSIWGKLLGGAAGFAMGGPLGALIGAVAGHAVDQMSAEDRAPGPAANGAKSVAFTIAVIVLGAKMAKADGRVTRDEVSAFRQMFHVPERELRNVGRIFNQARKDARGFEPYARQVAQMFRDNPAVLEELLGALFHIAKADGQVDAAEDAFLRQVAGIFGFDDACYARVRAEHVGGDGRDKADPYTVLGVERTASDPEIKAAYRRMVRENHPDRLMAQGLPEEFIQLANEKLAAINAAYDQVRRARGFN
jgi:DnaJ like chaperone protein